MTQFPSPPPLSLSSPHPPPTLFRILFFSIICISLDNKHGYTIIICSNNDDEIGKHVNQSIDKSSNKDLKVKNEFKEKKKGCREILFFCCRKGFLKKPFSLEGRKGEKKKVGRGELRWWGFPTNWSL